MAGDSESIPLSFANEIVDQEEFNETEILTEQAEVEIQSSEVVTGVEPQEKLIKLPLSRIRSIIKTDTDVKIASQEAVVTLAKAAELFIQSLATEAATRTIREKRKTVLRKHLDTVFETKDCYSFLEDKGFGDLITNKTNQYSSDVGENKFFEDWTTEKKGLHFILRDCLAMHGTSSKDFPERLLELRRTN